MNWITNIMNWIKRMKDMKEQKMDWFCITYGSGTRLTKYGSARHYEVVGGSLRRTDTHPKTVRRKQRLERDGS